MFSYLLQTVVGQIEANEQQRMIFWGAQINLILPTFPLKDFLPDYYLEFMLVCW
jgi:hypothetical protein